jgi:hypothetical protein
VCYSSNLSCNPMPILNMLFFSGEEYGWGTHRTKQVMAGLLTGHSLANLNDNQGARHEAARMALEALA